MACSGYACSRAFDSATENDSEGFRYKFIHHMIRLHSFKLTAFIFSIDCNEVGIILLVNEIVLHALITLNVSNRSSDVQYVLLMCYT